LWYRLHPAHSGSQADHDDLVEVINEKVAIIQLSGTHLDVDTLRILRKIFPHVTVRPFGCGSMMALATAITRQASEDDPVIHDTRSPYLTFSVIDPQTAGQWRMRRAARWR
jgi:hypothetical protein